MTVTDRYMNAFTHKLTYFLTYFLKINKTTVREPVSMKTTKEILLWFDPTMFRNLLEPKLLGLLQ